MPVQEKRVFSCPGCGQEIVVDSGMQRFLLLEGCVVCDSDVTLSNFDTRF